MRTRRLVRILGGEPGGLLEKRLLVSPLIGKRRLAAGAFSPLRQPARTREGRTKHTLAGLLKKMVDVAPVPLVSTTPA